MSKQILAVILALALVSMACGFTVNLPDRITVNTGPTQTDEIEVPVPDSKPVSLTLSFGAGEMMLNPGAGGALVSGTATYNVADFKPEVVTDGGAVEIKQSNLRVNGIPNFDGLENEWDLKLGNTPMDLTVKAGAYQGEFELGGLALTSLTIKDGAADVKINFSEPNQAEMSLLRYETGASNVTLRGLANANLGTLTFNGGAGNYTLDFSGELQRDATITIDSGVSNVTLVIPEGVNARVSIDAGLTNISTPSGWSQSGNTYAHEGNGPLLTFVIKLGAGNLTITE